MVGSGLAALAGQHGVLGLGGQILYRSDLRLARNRPEEIINIEFHVFRKPQQIQSVDVGASASGNIGNIALRATGYLGGLGRADPKVIEPIGQVNLAGLAIAALCHVAL